MINLSNLQKDKVSTAQVIADIGVLILVLINLTLILFNFLFSAELVQDFLKIEPIIITVIQNMILTKNLLKTFQAQLFLVTMYSN